MKSLYERTGDIRDFNMMLVTRGELRELRVMGDNFIRARELLSDVLGRADDDLPYGLIIQIDAFLKETT